MISLILKQHSNLMKQRLTSITLSRGQSDKYYCDEDYRNDFHSRYDNIKVDLSDYRDATDLYSLKKAYKLRIYNNNKIINVSALEMVHNLLLIHCKNIKNISKLTNVQILDISHCTKIKDIGNLRQLQELTITHEIEGIHLLKELKKLTLDMKYSKKWQKEYTSCL